jgi:two-component system, NtrC family, response regulator HydG
MAKEKINILIVDDDQDILNTARLFLKHFYENIFTINDPSRIPEIFNSYPIDIVLLDMNFKKGKNDGKEGIQWLKKITELDSSIIIIVITAYADISLAVKATKLNAFDFIVKPWENEKMLATIKAGLKHRKSELKIKHLENTQNHFQEKINNDYVEILGESAAIKKVKQTIDKVAKTDANVLILGENGSGKELIARSIHNKSTRNNNVFIGVDLGSLSETLFESELFGNVKGAFTDAKESKPGRFELANNGTVFLDEIGNISLQMQSKLLSVIQNKEFTPVGGKHNIKSDFRLICATNSPLYQQVSKKKFREDLLFRINTVEIKIPSLKERIEDIPQLAEHFINKYSKKYNKSFKALINKQIRSLKKYPWPGNVRELHHVIERAVIMSETNLLEFNLMKYEKSDPKDSAQEIVQLHELEKKHILNALDKHNGNISKTAKELGIARTALYRRIEKYDL